LLFWPERILASVEISFETPTAFADIRADYGGCIFGLGLFLGWCAMQRDRVTMGLLCSGLTFCGYASGRLLSLAIDGMPKRIIFILIGVEVAGAVVAFGLIPFAKSGETMAKQAETLISN